MEPRPLKTFIIYARKDTALKDELLRHLQLLVRKNLIVQWNDADLLPGEEWESRIMHELDASDLVLLLVSADAMHSDFIRKKELHSALEKKRIGKTRIQVNLAFLPVDVFTFPDLQYHEIFHECRHQTRH